MVDLSKKKVKQNMIEGTVLRAVSMIISYFYVPIVLSYLGDVKYGIWTTILNILSWISHFDIGIGNGLRNKLAEQFGKDNPDKNWISKLVSSAYIMISKIIFLAMIIGTLIFSIINWNSLLGVKSIDESIKLVTIVSLIFFCVNFVLSINKSIYYALQENAIVSLMGVLQQAILLVGTIILTHYFNPSLILVAIIYGLSDLVVELFFFIHLRKIDKSLVPDAKNYSKEAANETTGLGIKFFIVQMASLVLFSTDNLIISHFIGPESVTSYSLLNKLYSTGTAIFSIMVVPYWSRTSVAKARGDYKMILDEIKKMKLLWIVASIVALLAIPLIKPIFNIWLGKSFDFQNGMIFMMAIYAIIYMWNAIYSQIANGLSLMEIVVPVAIIQGIANIPLSLVFLLNFDMGMEGVLLGTIVSMLISAIWVPIYTHRYINKQIKYVN